MFLKLSMLPQVACDEVACDGGGGGQQVSCLVAKQSCRYWLVNNSVPITVLSIKF